MKIFNIIVFILIILTTSSCKENISDNFIVVMTVGDVNIELTNNVKTKVKSKDVVHSGSIINTGKNSYVILQSGNDLIVRVEPETEIKIFENKFNYMKKVFLLRGKLITKYEKKRMESSYSLLTSKFAINHDMAHYSISNKNNEISVSVKIGKLGISPQTIPMERIVNSGFTEIIGKNPQKKPISKNESLVIDKVTLLKSSTGFEKMNDVDIKKIQDDIKIKDEIINKEILKNTN